jgi:hypothetical protein
MKTRAWAASHGVCTSAIVPAVQDYHEDSPRSPADVARRAIVLHCIVAVGCGVKAQPVIEWLVNESLWVTVSSSERTFLAARKPTKKQIHAARWRQESQWALLWSIGHVRSLGLPTKTCDTRKLVDEIMPGLGDSIEEFVASARLRPPGWILAEEDRTYNLLCYARQATRTNSMPEDLIFNVLYERHYAFSWLGSSDHWDDVDMDT